MINITSKPKCMGCYSCASICPKNCIKMLSDEEGFLYPNVDENICVNCGLCEKACPIITPNQKASNEKCIAYAARTKDE